MLVLALMLAALDCSATSGKGLGSLPTERQILANADSRYRQQMDTLGLAAPIDGTPDQAWAALHTAYDEIGLKVTDEDQQGGRLGMQAAKCMRRIGKSAISAYFDCGSGITGPNADSYRVTVTTVSTVKKEGQNQVRVSTVAFADAVDMSGTASDRLGCSSSGRLEMKVLDTVRKAMGQKASGQ